MVEKRFLLLQTLPTESLHLLKVFYLSRNIATLGPYSLPATV
jgi:hypothetical protein